MELGIGIHSDLLQVVTYTFVNGVDGVVGVVESKRQSRVGDIRMVKYMLNTTVAPEKKEHDNS